MHKVDSRHIPDARHRCVPQNVVPRAAADGGAPLPTALRALAVANQLLATEWREPGAVQAQQMQ